MNNIFDAGESSARERMLSKKEGADLFEHNIWFYILLMKHCLLFLYIFLILLVSVLLLNNY